METLPMENLGTEVVTTLPPPPPPSIPGLEKFLADTGYWIVGKAAGWKDIRPIMDRDGKLILNTRFIANYPWWVLKPANYKLHMWDLDDKEIMNMTRHIEYWDIGNGYHTVIRRLLVKHSPDGAKVGYILQSACNMELYQMFDHTDKHLYDIKKIEKRKRSAEFFLISTPDGSNIGTVKDNKGAKHHVKLPTYMPLTHKAMLLCLSCHLQRMYHISEEEYV